MKRKIFVKCPNCNHENMYYVKFTTTEENEVVNCSMLDGCGQKFAINYTMEVLVHLQVSKIEFK